MEHAFEITDLCKSFARPERTIEVLSGINLKVTSGTFVALVGDSGCGKTTLLQLLGALDDPTSGQIRSFGHVLNEMGVSRKAKFRLQEIGFVFQSYQLLPELSAFENILLAARLSKMPEREAKEKSQVLLERVGMADRHQHRPAELSGGERQRIAIARALINDPRVILADEPTGNLDPRNSESVLELLQDLQEGNRRTIVLVTHSQALASRADIVYSMSKGTLHR